MTNFAYLQIDKTVISTAEESSIIGQFTKQYPVKIINELFGKTGKEFFLYYYFFFLSVDLAELRMDAELMTSTGTMLQMELDKIEGETKPDTSNTEDMDTSVPTENPQ